MLYYLYYLVFLTYHSMIGFGSGSLNMSKSLKKNIKFEILQYWDSRFEILQFRDGRFDGQFRDSLSPISKSNIAAKIKNSVMFEIVSEINHPLRFKDQIRDRVLDQLKKKSSSS